MAQPQQPPPPQQHPVSSGGGYKQEPGGPLPRNDHVSRKQFTYLILVYIYHFHDIMYEPCLGVEGRSTADFAVHPS